MKYFCANVAHASLMDAEVGIQGFSVLFLSCANVVICHLAEKKQQKKRTGIHIRKRRGGANFEK